tara:strand:- start:169963 stop:170160 length:198 start_codon:yes stop_codon:yes gene_type:complete
MESPDCFKLFCNELVISELKILSNQNCKGLGGDIRKTCLIRDIAIIYRVLSVEKIFLIITTILFN